MSSGWAQEPISARLESDKVMMLASMEVIVVQNRSLRTRWSSGVDYSCKIKYI